MIDWQIVQKGQKNISEKGWGFRSSHIQEYLLPIINVGFSFIDEYDDTQFNLEDCRRLMGNIDYMLHSGILTRRSKIKIDSFYGQLVELDTKGIIDCLQKLRDAASKTITLNASLVFFGD